MVAVYLKRRLQVAAPCRALWSLLLDNLERCALVMPRGRARQQRSNRLNRLAVAANDAADIALPELNLKHRGLPVGHFREHHFIRKFDQLADNKLEKFFHRPKNSRSGTLVDAGGR